MFQKRIIEVISLLVYCFIVTPMSYNYCKNKKIVRKIETDDLLETLYENCTFILCALIGYVVYYRIIMFSYMRLKVIEKGMWKKVKEAKKDPEAFFGKKSCNKSPYKGPMHFMESEKMKRKQVPKMIRTISNPLVIESDLARIHIKHETRPLEIVTLPRHQAQVHPSTISSLRRAPPVPQKQENATLPKIHTKSRIVSSNIIMAAA